MTDPGVAIGYTPLGTNMEFEDLTLPRDKFNRFRYFFVVHPYFTFFLLLDLTTIGICSVWFKLRGPGDAFDVFLPVALPATFFILLFAAIADYHDVPADNRNSVSFLGEVVKFRPGLDENKWDLIAARTNRVFHHKNNKITPYFFYDGAKCHSYFKWWYISPGTARVTKSNSSETVDVGIQVLIDKALKVYTDSVEEYWGQYMAEINDNSEQNNVRNESDKDQTLS